MKINGEFVERDILNEKLLIPVGETSIKFNGMITVNETGIKIWDLIKQGKSREEICCFFESEYDVTKETVENDVDEFLNLLRQQQLISE